MQLERLKEWRESQGFTQRELADKAGVGEVTVARVETGASVRPNTARKIASALGLAVSDLLEHPPALAGASPKAQAPPSPPSEGPGEEGRRDLGRLEEGRLISAIRPFDNRLAEEAAYWRELVERGEASWARLEDASKAREFTIDHFLTLVDSAKRERWSDGEIGLLMRVYEKGIAPHEAAWKTLFDAYVAAHRDSDLTRLRERDKENQQALNEAGELLRAKAGGVG
jgi:transcriptional regulator with XRE-family HTH domain